MDPPDYGHLDLPRLPAYSRAEHIYELTGQRGPWATLKVLSSARKSRHMPIFVEGDNITGSFSLNLKKDDHIVAVTVSVKGQILSASHFDSGSVFLEDKQTLWSKEMGDPRNPSSIRYSGKLSGSYTWSFSFTLPSHVNFFSGTFRLPESFLERHSQTSIQYDIEVHIIRSRFRVDSKLQTMFIYVPGTRPSPPSLLRQLAYQENRPFPGPDADPSGWEGFGPFTINGKMFRTRETDVQCTFYLGKPLCYTRGSPVPCAISIYSADSQALELLATPPSIHVRLTRSVRSRNTSAYLPNQNPECSVISLIGGLKNFVQDIAEPVWWEETAVPNGKNLIGEILLPPTLKPSCLMGQFSIEYAVDVLPFKSQDFVTSADSTMLHQVIEVATLFARCPRPRSYAPQQPTRDVAISDNYIIPPPRTVI